MLLQFNDLISFLLTNNGQRHGEANWWSCAYLTLVNPAVPALRISDLEGPVFCHRIVYAGEPLVGCVGEPANC